MPKLSLIAVLFVAVGVLSLVGLIVALTNRTGEGTTSSIRSSWLPPFLTATSAAAAAISAIAAWRAAGAAERSASLQLHTHESARRSSASAAELTSILERLHDADPEKLDPILRARVVAWSQAMKPYLSTEYDAGVFEFRDQLLSPEKGQLVGALLAAQIPLERFLPGLDVRRADLRGFQLPGMLLDGINWSYSDFSDANLRGASFKDADLRQVSFVHTDLAETNLEGAMLEGVHLRGANLAGSNLDDIARVCCWTADTQWPEGVTLPAPEKACTKRRTSTSLGK